MTEVVDGGTGAPIARTPTRETFAMLGGPLELVASIEAPAGDAVLLRSRMAPGATVPLHSHADPECFLVLEGEIDAFADDGRGWRTMTTGSSISMENGIAHALLAGDAGADLLITTNHRLAEFFRKAQHTGGDGPSAGPPGAEDVAHVVEVAKAYGYWMASPDEHSAVTGRPLSRP